MSDSKRGVGVDIHVGERLELDNGRIVIVLEHKTGKAARLMIVADKSLKIVFPKRERHSPPA